MEEGEDGHVRSLEWIRGRRKWQFIVEEAGWHGREAMEVDDMLGAENAGLDACDRKVRGEKAIQEK